jgi:hypothetical protein
MEVKHKTSKTKNEESSEEGSTNEDTTFAIRKYTKFLKSKASRKGGDERKNKSQRKRYECGEYGYFIAKCPKNKNKNEEEKKYKEKSKEYKNKYQGYAHVGQQWDSSDEDEEPKKQGMAMIAKAQRTSSPRLSKRPQARSSIQRRRRRRRECGFRSIATTTRRRTRATLVRRTPPPTHN